MSLTQSGLSSVMSRWILMVLIVTTMMFVASRAQRQHTDVKRLGSEFLGKRSSSGGAYLPPWLVALSQQVAAEDYDQSRPNAAVRFEGSEDGPEIQLGKRLGSEFLGKRSGFQAQQIEKRLGSEFLGRRRRAAPRFFDQ